MRERVEEAGRVNVLTHEGANLAAAASGDAGKRLTILDPLAAVEHVLEGGELAIEPGSLGLCVVTLDPGKGAIARDELHDSVPENPVCVTRSADGECQVWYRGDGSRAPERRWKHGRVVARRGWVTPAALGNLTAGLARARRDRRPRAADLSRLPAAIH